MEDLFNLSAPQNSILLTEQYYRETSINNIGGGIIIHDVLDFNIFKKAINNFVKFNDSFRIRLKQSKTEVKQYFEDFSEFDIDIIDLKNETEVYDFSKRIMSKPINIFEEKLFEFIIFRLPNNHGGYIAKMHHLISDGWTSGLLCRKIMHEYSNLLNGEDSIFDKDLSYKKYLETEQKYFSSQKFEKDKSYWTEKFNTVPNPITLPSIHEKNVDFSYEGTRQSFVISKKEMDNIKDYCAKHSISVFNFFMAILSTYLSKINDSDDFVIGTPILNRSNITEKNTSGMFINIAPLRINFENKITFIDLLSSISKDSMGLLRHQKYPYQTLLEDLRKKDSSIPNLYNIVLSYQVTRSNNECDIPYDTFWTSNGCTADDFDMHLSDLDEQGSLNVNYDYKTSKYNDIEIENTHKRLMNIIKQVLKNDSIEIKDIEIVTPDEKHKILVEFNNTKVDYPKNKTIVDLFEEQVEKTPDNIAVVCNDEKLTYRELNEKANQLAWYLKEQGIKKGSVVGIMANRDIYLIIAIWAIEKLGCIYLPINPEYPTDRISYILKDSNSEILLTNFETPFEFNKKINLKKFLFSNYQKVNLNISISPNDLTYIIYTSGSTGKPKGVMVQHYNLVNFIYSFNNQFNKPFNETDNCLSTTNISFDVSICEIFVPLLFGSTLVLYNKNNLDNIPLLCTILEEQKISFLYLPPNILLNVFEFIQNNNINVYFNKMLVGVEPIKAELLNNYSKLNPEIEIINGYGPTETTICITFFKFEKNNNANYIIPIGKPLNNNNIIIVNSNFDLLPIGICGEILISGSNVTRGYLNNKTETDKNYITLNNKKYYKTGDIGSWLADGNIMFENRNDSQIKFRGHRIELNEINLAIKKIYGITSSITLLQNLYNTDYLCSYVTCHSNLTTKSINNELQKILPDYMIPNFIIILENMPINLNGKIDKKSLPLPTFSNSNTRIIKPRNDIDKNLINIFKKILHIDKISIANSFFELGGDSLSAIKLCIELYNIFRIQLSVKDIFEHSVLSDLSDYIITYQTTSTTIKKIKHQDFYHTSSAQKRMYYATKTDSEESVLYNIPGALVFDKTPDIEKLKLCFENLFERHESLRTYFEIRNDNIVQKIAPNINLKLEVKRSTSTNTEYLLKQFIKPFNLAKAPLFCATLVLQPNDTATLLINMHHSISDGTSVSILLDELSKLYNDENLPENEITYKDFCEWENTHFTTSEFRKSENYWLSKFNDELPVLNMPTTFSRPVNQNFDGDSIHFEIDKTLKNKITKICQELNITPYMFLLANYYILLYKYTNQDDIIIGNPVTGRELPELSNIVGMFVNSLPIRSNINSNLSFKTFVNQIKKICLDAFEHQDYPFDMLVNKLDTTRNTNRNPLFDTMFIYQNMGAPKLNFKGIKTKYVEANTNISKFDFSLEIIPNKNNFDLRFEYCTKLFDQEFIQNLGNRYIKIIKQITHDYSTKISNINILSEKEKNQILYDFNKTDFPYDKEKNIQTIFEENAQNYPDKIAIIFENQSITYKELNEKANRLAHYLIEKNIKQNDIVGIMLNRSIDTIICMLGILKSGSAYMLIDHELPKDRIEFMLNNANAKLLITNSKLKKFDFNNICYYDKERLNNYNINNPNITCNNQNTFCIIYTSGSTGTPKGITLKRQGVINLVLTHQKLMNTNSCNNFLSMSSIAFDMFIVENFVPLLSAKTVILTNEEEQKIPELISKLITKYNIDFILTTPSRIELIMHTKKTATCLKYLKNIQLGGEVFSQTLLEKLKKYTNADIYNGYGPSEITACCSNHKVSSNKLITIGKPNCNTKIYILDNDLNLCPIGIEGEICISGDGVSKGYINNPEMTKKSFIKNPFGNGILYKSGDIGKWTNDGEIEYIGRKDFQIKIRGLRVELSEIENKFLDIPEINNCCIIYKQEGNDNYLVRILYSNYQY